MNPGLDIAVLMAKAERACESARLLPDDGDLAGACNRAYYGMFDAARAVLLRIEAPVPPEIAKTHSGLIAAFGLHVVKPGLAPLELGRTLNWAEDLRLIADCRGDTVEHADALDIVEKAANFVRAMHATFMAG